MSDASKNTQANPLLEKSNLRDGAFPFDRLKDDHYLPALEVALKEARANLEKMKADSSVPTFENVILALETGTQKLGRVSSIFYNLLHAETSPKLQDLAKTIAPKLAEFASDVSLDPKVFQRVKAVWDSRKDLGLADEELRLTEKTYKDFARNGALLDDAKKAKLREIDMELSKLHPQFNENVLKATNAFELFITDKKDLAGLPETSVEAAAEAAKAKGKDGQWLITLDYPSYMPFLTYGENRSLREKLYRAYLGRAFRDAQNNEPIAKRIATLRHERAQLLGFKTHANFVLEERMAETPERVSQFLENILVKAKPACDREVNEVRALAKKEGGIDDLQPWDFIFWSEKLKMKLHSFDDETLRPYFKLENCIEGVFEHARRLYGLAFKEVKDVPVYHPDIRTYEVSEASSGRYIGLFYADFFPRSTKQGGAWANSIREQGLQGGTVERPHSTITCNFPKSTASTPSLLSIDEVRTLFHEFGHALHSLLSDVKYVSLAGTSVYWDFVELPSQIMENWAVEEEGLDLFARHYQTGEKIPRDLIKKIRDTARFQAGYYTMRQLVFAMLDLAWHSGDPSAVTDVDAFEKKVTSRAAPLKPVEGANISCSFSHIFAGGYDAGYYSYKWAEVLDADAFEFFKEKGLFDGEVARKFRDNVLSRGGTKHPMELYKAFRGREPDPDALLRRDGLI